MLDITTIILTYNEEKHIRRCIENTRQISKIVYVIDSFSTDRTCEIAEKCGAIVLQNKYINQSQQFIWALKNCHIDTAWTMRMDADEYLTDNLIEEIKQTLPHLPKAITGCMMKRNVVLLGKELKYGKLKSIRLMRLWRTGKAKMEKRWMDEQLYITEGKTINMKHIFIDENLNGLTEWIQKHNYYSNREIVAAYESFWNSSNNEVLELEKRNVSKSKYYKLPKFLRAFIYFFIRYICFGGFLDGKPGFIWATLQAYWYRFLVDSKIEEMEYYIGKKPTPQEMRQYFKERFNIDVNK